MLFIFIIGDLMANDKYKNPVDGKTYHADEWKTYEPQKQKKENESRLENLGIRLLSSQEEFEANIDVSTLSAYTKAIESRILEIIESYPNSGDILLQVEISNNNSPKYKMSYQGNLTQEILQKIYDSLNKENGIRTKKSNVAFQIHYKIKI